MTTALPPRTLHELAARVRGARVLGDGSRAVGAVFQDSRRVTPGALFAARRGERSDGRAFVADALARGAAAVLTDDEALARSLDVPAILVDDARVAVAFVAARIYGDPFDALTMIGVTGTNGKTTSTHLVSGMLSGMGFRPATLGTLGVRFGDLELPGQHTTPESDDLARTAAELVAGGATHLVMEVSSHALSLGRVEAVRFRVAAITNLSHDHLDFHLTLEAYGEAKKRLFTELAPLASVLNIDDAFAATLEGQTTGRLVRVSPRGVPRAELRVLSSEISAAGIQAMIAAPGGTLALRSSLTGAHNLENLLVALGIAAALDLDLTAATSALGRAPAVPGRLERVSDERDDVLVLVDYAHTPDALGRALAAVRPLSRGRVVCVFGCGGDRDRQKRGPMGAVAAAGADEIVVTNDNPRSESPEEIAQTILRGVEDAGKTARVVLDRARAIEEAVLSAAPGDAVLIAGKGHEPYQIVGAVTRAFDDRDEARRALGKRREPR